MFAIKNDKGEFLDEFFNEWGSLIEATIFENKEDIGHLVKPEKLVSIRVTLEEQPYEVS